MKVNRTFSLPANLVPFLNEAAHDHGGLSAFVQSVTLAYVDAKQRLGRIPRGDELEREILKARLEATRREKVVKDGEEKRLERRLEEIQQDEEQRRASGAASLTFESPEALVTAFRGKVPAEAEANWRNLANRHGLKPKDVFAIVQRDARQSTIAPPPNSYAKRVRGFGKATTSYEAKHGGKAGG